MLTVVKVDVLGDLVPRAVVEVTHLLLVLHHAGRLAFLLVLEGYVVLDRFKVLPMLKNKATVEAQSLKLGRLPYDADASRERGLLRKARVPHGPSVRHGFQPRFPRTSGFNQSNG